MVEEQKQEMIEKIQDVIKKYREEGFLAIEKLRKVNVDKWVKKIPKSDVDALRLALREARTQVTAARKLVDAVLESFDVFEAVFNESVRKNLRTPFSNQPAKSQPSAISPSAEIEFSNRGRPMRFSKSTIQPANLEVN